MTWAAAVPRSCADCTRRCGLVPGGGAVTATVIGEVADISRFASKDGFAAYNGTAPIEVSSGKRKVHRLSRRGNRKLNYAAHMTAVTSVGLTCRHTL